MKNKKGLSGVVTNVLIILLVVVAVGILWAFVSPLFTQSGEKIQQAQACLDMQLEPIKCVAAGTDANVTVKRDAGEANLAEIKIIFEKADGSSEVETVTDVPDQLETRIYAMTGLDSTATRVSVSGGIANTQGDISYCSESAKIDC